MDVRRSSSAEAVAVAVRPFFEPDSATGSGTPVPAPTVEEIALIVDAAFWASMRREEGVSPTISLAFLSPEQTNYPLLLERSLTVSPESLTRLAPAVKRPGIHLGIWRDNGRLSVWGTTRSLPRCCFVLEVSAPGLLVVKESPRTDTGKFINVAVLEGDKISVIARESNEADNVSAPLHRSSSPCDAARLSTEVFLRLALSMRAHGRGGALLVVPTGGDEWRQSILHPMLYSVAPAFAELTALTRTPASEPNIGWASAFHDAVELVAGLSAVDGGTIISQDCELLAFGAKIRRRDGFGSVEEVHLTEPVVGAEPRVCKPEELGGTRHLSAAQFVHDQRDAAALVASQDGRFTSFSWAASKNMVHARRLEMLLL